MEIKVGRYTGFCPGVKRALRLAEGVLARAGGPVFTLGPLIHNPQEVERLRQAGLGILPDEESELAALDLAGAWVVYRSHGVSPQIDELLKSKGARIVDATCKMVESARDSAIRMAETGCDLVIVGRPDHPEIRGIVAHVERAVERLRENGRGPTIVVTRDRAGLAGLGRRSRGRRIGVIAQTTVDLQSLADIVGGLLPLACELHVFNTICRSTSSRQEEALQLARTTEVMVVVGGRNSSNTARLRRICEEAGATTYHVENATELRPAWIKGASRVGVVGGASTPAAAIDDVVAELTRIAG
ncbi:MAG: 4-hydroxy-3-methylbut-2-enyl diphosphate reductase [Candidatus Geothermincolia bacterium]